MAKESKGRRNIIQGIEGKINHHLRNQSIHQSPPEESKGRSIIIQRLKGYRSIIIYGFCMLFEGSIGALLLVHGSSCIMFGRIMILLGISMVYGNGYRCQGDKAWMVTDSLSSHFFSAAARTHSLTHAILKLSSPDKLWIYDPPASASHVAGNTGHSHQI